MSRQTSTAAPPPREINLSDARALAAVQAKAMLDTSEADMLSPDYVEAEGCWIFFRSRELTLPSHMELSASAAYAVSKWGEVRIVADCSDSPDQMNSLLALLSGYFLRSDMR